MILSGFTTTWLLRYSWRPKAIFNWYDWVQPAPIACSVRTLALRNV